MFVRSRYKRKYCHYAIYIIFILQNMYQPGLYLSVVEIEEVDSILEHLGDVTLAPYVITYEITPTEYFPPDSLSISIIYSLPCTVASLPADKLYTHIMDSGRRANCTLHLGRRSVRRISAHVQQPLLLNIDPRRFKNNKFRQVT